MKLDSNDLYVDFLRDPYIGRWPRIYNPSDYTYFYDVDAYHIDFLNLLESLDCCYRTSSSGHLHVMSNDELHAANDMYKIDIHYNGITFFNNKGNIWAATKWFHVKEKKSIEFKSFPKIIIRKIRGVYFFDEKDINLYKKHYYILRDVIFINDVNHMPISYQATVWKRDIGHIIVRKFRRWKHENKL